MAGSPNEDPSCVTSTNPTYIYTALKAQDTIYIIGEAFNLTVFHDGYVAVMDLVCLMEANW